ncbi:MAG: biopolymer transporter ExbD [Myxococcota bacterium]
MGANVGGKKGAAKAEINITPLVDVVLVLLIIFMVVSPGDSTYLANAIPKPAQLDDSQVIANDQMVLELFADGSARLNQKEIQHKDFTQTLKETFATRSDKKLFVSAEDEVPYGEVVGWMGMAKSAGAVLMALKLTPVS